MFLIEWVWRRESTDWRFFRHKSKVSRDIYVCLSTVFRRFISFSQNLLFCMNCLYLLNLYPIVELYLRFFLFILSPTLNFPCSKCLLGIVIHRMTRSREQYGLQILRLLKSSFPIWTPSPSILAFWRFPQGSVGGNGIALFNTLFFFIGILWVSARSIMVSVPPSCIYLNILF